MAHIPLQFNAAIGKLKNGKIKEALAHYQKGLVNLIKDGKSIYPYSSVFMSLVLNKQDLTGRDKTELEDHLFKEGDHENYGFYHKVLKTYLQGQIATLNSLFDQPWDEVNRVGKFSPDLEFIKSLVAIKQGFGISDYYQTNVAS
jgi:hypothetical protein